MYCLVLLFFFWYLKKIQSLRRSKMQQSTTPMGRLIWIIVLNCWVVFQNTIVPGCISKHGFTWLCSWSKNTFLKCFSSRNVFDIPSFFAVVWKKLHFFSENWGRFSSIIRRVDLYAAKCGILRNDWKVVS